MSDLLEISRKTQIVRLLNSLSTSVDLFIKSTIMSQLSICIARDFLVNSRLFPLSCLLKRNVPNVSFCPDDE